MRVILTVLLLASVSAAGPIYFDGDEAGFAAAAGTTLDTFGFDSPFFGNPDSVDFGDFTFAETGGTNLVRSTAGAHTGDRAIYYSDNGNSVGIFSFDSPINAFAVYVRTVPSARTVTVGGDLSTSFTTPANTYKFFGVIDTTGTFDTISFDVSGGDFVVFDTLSYGTVATVPEPGTFVLLGMAMLGYGVYRRRRKSA